MEKKKNKAPSAKSVLDRIDSPADLKGLELAELETLAQEIRDLIVETVSRNGGHLAPSLGVVELAIALHFVFDSPKDKVIWDVGHQAYAHKILTGRREQFHTLRKYKGISGFPRRTESPYDSFSTGHSGTSISAGLGISTAKSLKGDKSKVIAVIGDGSMTAGMAFEALNQAGHTERDLIVILNDNEMSIAKNVGALSSYVSRKISEPRFVNLKKRIEYFLRSVPGVGENILTLFKRSEDSLITLLTPGMLFEALKFRYIGPIRGHELNLLIRTFKDVAQLDGPVLLHVFTTKGKGYAPAEKNPTFFHGIGSFDKATGLRKKDSAKEPPSYTEVFGRTMVELGSKEKRLYAITAAMPEGTGLSEFARVFPNRFIDVGIAEQHAVTFAAGLATEGLKPVVAIYSTFLQRAFDQIIHDVCLPNLPVIFTLDRGGIVGDDGPTHHGLFDLSYLRIIPNMTIMAPKDENELRHMLFTSLASEGPVAIRYPRGKGVGVPMDSEYKNIPTGKAEILTEGKDLLILAIGSRVHPCLEAAAELEKEGHSVSVVNCRFVKPLDPRLPEMAASIGSVLIVEENTLKGGFGSAVLEFFCDHELPPVSIKRLGIPDAFVEHGPQSLLREKCGIGRKEIVEGARKLLTHHGSAKKKLDQLLVEKGLLVNRQRARGIILAGLVTIDGKKVDKPGHLVSSSAAIDILGPDHPYVSRGGIKLEAALTEFALDVTNLTVLDVGASTGGFTDCLLQHDAKKVFAVDVGYGQLAWSLRNDPRVVVLERTNIRHLSPAAIGEDLDGVVIDTSFISLRIVVPAALKFLKKGGFLVALIKPQFEAGKNLVGKGGIVRDTLLQKSIVDDLSAFFSTLGLVVRGTLESPITGAKGNREYFIYLTYP